MMNPKPLRNFLSAESIAEDLEEDLKAAEERCDDSHAGVASAYGYLSASVAIAIRRIRKVYPSGARVTVKPKEG